MKNISNLILSKAREKSVSDKRLRRLLCKSLDDALVKHIEFIQIEKGILRLHVKNSTWASRLRFFANEILTITQQTNVSVNQVKVCVNVMPRSETLQRQTRVNRKNIPASSLDGLDEMVSIMEDNPLQNSLRNLVSNARKRNLNTGKT